MVMEKKLLFLNLRKIAPNLSNKCLIVEKKNRHCQTVTSWAITQDQVMVTVLSKWNL